MMPSSSVSAIQLTEAQREAIQTIEQNLQIVACAGAGKTQVLAERLVEILRRKGPDGLRPANIVAFTFTERAGAELKDRIIGRVREELKDIVGLAEMYVGTIHGYCLQLLQAHLPEYYKYSVLDDIQTRLLIDRSSTQSGLTDLGLKRYVDSALFLDVLNIVREGDVDPLVLGDHPVLASLEKYQSLMEKKRYFDYTEILVRSVAALVDDAALRSAVAGQVKYLIVDEYQDVNPLQEAIVRLLSSAGANVCVVGDDDQTIYQWRGSDVSNMLTFKDRYSDVKVVTIDENYRCSDGVVDAARTVIEHNSPQRLPKAMRSASSQTFERGDVLAQEFANPTEEAAWIAEKVASLIGTPFRDRATSEPRGLAPSDFAVLLRSVRRSGEPIIHALQAAGVPVVVGGMTNLFDTPEVNAARGLFLFMAGQADSDELKQLWVDAGLGVDRARLDAAITVSEQERNWDSDERWSVYNLQRTFLRFLENIGLREEAIPPSRSGQREHPQGELAYYNLGKFSQVISDFEQIHFQSDPARKYEAFAGFLKFQAPNYYPEGWQDAAYVRPNAVQVMTVHQAKGMEWPVVFLPNLVRNRFPAKAPGGRGRWHVVPRAAFRKADLYDGSITDERRLFYVALTRSQKFLYASWAPVPGNKLYQRPSQFLQELTACPRVLTREPRRIAGTQLQSTPKRSVANVALTFSELKYFFDCPYEFKLRFLYGFNPPLHEALGYGKSLHDALAEVHKRALAGEVLDVDSTETLVDRHLHLPFAYPELQASLRTSAIASVRRYLRDNGHLLTKTEHVEQVVEINMGDGVLVNGRIDLIRRTDTKEIIVIDFKSTSRAQAEDVSRMQLHVYSLGYRELTGTSADFIEIYNLDKGGSLREEVDARMEATTTQAILGAAKSLRENSLGRLVQWSTPCVSCDLAGICRDAPAT